MCQRDPSCHFIFIRPWEPVLLSLDSLNEWCADRATVESQLLPLRRSEAFCQPSWSFCLVCPTARGTTGFHAQLVWTSTTEVLDKDSADSHPVFGARHQWNPRVTDRPPSPGECPLSEPPCMYAALQQNSLTLSGWTVPSINVWLNWKSLTDAFGDKIVSSGFSKQRHPCNGELSPLLLDPCPAKLLRTPLPTAWVQPRGKEKKGNKARGDRTGRRQLRS